jgi:glycosyltransferase involved in cell wall biosynthesis
MELSVIIPASGRNELLIRCLKSLDQNTDFEYEICVVDDGSGLNETDIREKAGVSYPLIWCSFETPRGRAAARNEGIRSTSGEIIVFLDSDMEAHNSFLESHLISHRKYPRTTTIGRIEWPKGGSFLRYIGTRGVAKLKPGESVPPKYFVTGNTSIERRDLPAESPFDISFRHWGGEDFDLGMKLAASGIRFMYEPSAVSYHHFDSDLRTHLTRTYLYGGKTLPVLTERYPEIIRLTSLHVLDSFLWRFLVKKTIFYSILFLTNILDALPLPMQVFDYLTFAAYARGWLEGKRR